MEHAARECVSVRAATPAPHATQEVGIAPLTLTVATTPPLRASPTQTVSVTAWCVWMASTAALATTANASATRALRAHSALPKVWYH